MRLYTVVAIGPIPPLAIVELAIYIDDVMYVYLFVFHIYT